MSAPGTQDTGNAVKAPPSTPPAAHGVMMPRWLRPRSPRASGEPRPFTLMRRRLVITNLLATVFVLLVISVTVYIFEARMELGQIDAQLAREATGQANKGLPAAAAPDTAEAPYDPRGANFFSIVMAPTGQVLQDDDQAQRLGLPDWASARPVLSGAQAAAYARVRHGSVRFRLYTVPIRDHGRIVGAVQSGMSLGAYHQQLHDLARGLLALDLFIALLMLGSSVYLTERALKPARVAFERQRQFAAGASHELRTPLALIRSLAELVSDHRCAPAIEPAMTTADSPARSATSAPPESEERVADDAREIIHEVDYMTRLVTDLLLLARDERDRRALNWTTVDLRRILGGVVDKIEPLAGARGITLISDLDGGADGHVAALMDGDPDRLRQLALSLIENAVRYTPRGGRVVVSLKTTRGAPMRAERHGVATFTVRDSGVGIAPEDQPHVFEPFYRASSSSLRRASAAEPENAGGAGSGLGLALARWIVEAHKGRISLQSAPDAGTTVTVELPLFAHSRSSGQ